MSAPPPVRPSTNHGYATGSGGMNWADGANPLQCIVINCHVDTSASDRSRNRYATDSCIFQRRCPVSGWTLKRCSPSFCAFVASNCSLITYAECWQIGSQWTQNRIMPCSAVTWFLYGRFRGADVDTEWAANREVKWSTSVVKPPGGQWIINTSWVLLGSVCSQITIYMLTLIWSARPACPCIDYGCPCRSTFHYDVTLCFSVSS